MAKARTDEGSALWNALGEIAPDPVCVEHRRRLRCMSQIGPAESLNQRPAKHRFAPTGVPKCNLGTYDEKEQSTPPRDCYDRNGGRIMAHHRGAPTFFRQRGIECDQLPDHVFANAQNIIEQIESGAHFGQLNGKRMFFDRRYITIPVGRSYRLIAREREKKLVFQKLVTHENYNKILSRH